MEQFRKLKVKDIMSKDVSSVNVPGKRSSALDIMKENNISGVPVVEKKTKNFLGILTRHDIYDNPNRDQIAMLYENSISTIGKNARPTELVRLFIDSGQYWIPVVDEKKLTGIVTPTDFLPYIEKLFNKESVLDFMGRHSVVPIYHKNPISFAFHTLKITRIPALPVLDSSSVLMGIVSDIDIFKMLISGKSGVNFEVNTEDDDWSWESVRDFRQIYALPEISLPELTVGQVMVTEVKYLYPHSAVSKAAKTMRLNNIGQLPVCNSDDVIVGMLYNYDLLPLLLQ